MQDKSEAIPLYFLTYNLNKQPINEVLLSEKLIEELPSKLSNLYCFSLQEFCSILDGCFHANANQILIRFNTFLLSLLNDKYNVNFQTIAMDHVGSTALLILSPYPSKFQDIRVAKSSVGYWNSSLKGGVAARMRYLPEGRYDKKEVEITVLSCHLNAYEGEYYYEMRKQNLYTIIRSLDFQDGYGLIKGNNHIFIMGDLNFRTTKKFKAGSVETKKLFSLNDSSLVEGNIPDLNREIDELTKGLINGELLIGFSESKVTFSPTYKYHLKTSIYNSKRSPSWCDRILYLNTYEDPNEIDLKLSAINSQQNPRFDLPVVNKYASIESILLSDHKPVILDITIPFTPPKSIIHELSGCLQILPSGQTAEEGFNNFNTLKGLSSKIDIVSGPTTIYLKQTNLDFLIQNLNRPIADWLIGYSLWFTTTQNGRLMLFLLVLILWSVWYLGGFS